MKRIILTVFVVLFLCPAVYAVPVLDQYIHADSPACAMYLSENSALAQTFTPQISGQLTRLDLFMVERSAVSVDGNMIIDFWIAGEDTPKSTFMDSFTISSLSLHSDWNSLDLSLSSVYLYAGQTYSIVPRSDTVDFLPFALSYTYGLPSEGDTELADYIGYYGYSDWYDYYTGGELLARQRATGLWEGSTGDHPPLDYCTEDLMFRTYVEPVPEPSSFFLLLIGIAGLFYYRRSY